MTSARPTLRAFAHPGRLSLRGLVPGAEPAALAAAGRQTLSQLRAALLPGPPAGAQFMAGRRAADLPSLALRAALAAPACQAEALVVLLLVENAAGDSASLSWRREGGRETLHWSCRGGPIREDGACRGSATVAAALAR